MDQKQKESENLIAEGFVKTEGFEKSVVFLMSLMGQIWEVSQKYKSFRMELDYDAEALNTQYRFYLPSTIGESDCIEGELASAKKEALASVNDSIVTLGPGNYIPMQQ